MNSFPSTQEMFELLYDTFRRYPKPKRVSGSPISVEANDDLTLLQKPLKSLDAKDFGRYPFKAMSTWGTVADFKYFLPRILELSFDNFTLLNSTTLFSKILSSGWIDWQEDEKKAFEAYLLTLWSYATNRLQRNFHKVEVLAEHLPYFGIDCGELVYAWAKEWIEEEEEEHFRDLVLCIESNWIEIFYGSKPHGTFSDAILESRLMERLETVFFKYEKHKPEFAAAISSCEQKISDYLATR